MVPRFCAGIIGLRSVQQQQRKKTRFLQNNLKTILINYRAYKRITLWGESQGIEIAGF